MEESVFPGDKAEMRSVYKIMDVSILKLCWWWLEDEACLPTPTPFPRGNLMVVPHCLFIMQGNEGLLKAAQIFSHQRSAFTSYWDVCFHFKVNFWNFFSYWVDLKGFDLVQERQRKTLKHFPLRSSHNFKLLQVSWKSPGNVISSLWRWWWP